MEFFATLEAIRDESDIPVKLGRLRELATALDSIAQVSFAPETPVQPVGNPSFAKICQIVHGSQVGKRRNLGTTEGRIIFLHALAHIEYSAIDLALDSAYRFRGLPPQFYEDWFTVALDEARHFAMLNGLLRKLGSYYGALAVHTGIHDAMARSATSLRRRMAATHRHLEANGLDAHPELARKFAGFTDTAASEIRQALKIIFDDEIKHVAAGDFWFRYACALDGASTDIFTEDVTQAIPGTKFGRKSLNISARKQAGFTDSELAALTDHGL
ncbi:MAG: ferritin-like domain-containing protein [Spirochaetes bacterium]|nr:ferritin-like domain-containing protein [Spirochaetota bacterium]